jgi:hypothetical protein
MHKPIFIGLALCATAPAFGVVLFDQTGGRTGDGYFSDGISTNGSQFYAQSMADDFTLSSNSVVQKIVFYGSSENFMFPDLTNFSSWDVVIYDSAFNPVFSANVAKAALNPTATGLINSVGGAEYEMTFNTSVNLNAGSYRLHVGSINNAPGDDAWAWSTATGNVNAYYNWHDGAGWNQFGDDMAFRIEGVPEPATIAALGLGITALLRRRSKK